MPRHFGIAERRAAEPRHFGPMEWQLTVLLTGIGLAVFSVLAAAVIIKGV
jgi:hypothetical protein